VLPIIREIQAAGATSLRASVVTSEQWRSFAYRSGISGGEKRAQQRAFERAVLTLRRPHRMLG
jgi:hypothetical protein